MEFPMNIASKVVSLLICQYLVNCALNAFPA